MTHVQNKDAKLSLLALAKTLASSLDVLLQLLDSVLEGSAGVIDLVDNQDALADKVLHLADSGQVKPLRASDLCARDLGDARGRVAAESLRKALVQRETDGLDGDVGVAGLLQEGTEDTGGNVAAAADCDDELGLEGLEDLDGGLLAEVVHLEGEEEHSLAHVLRHLARIRRPLE